MCLLIAYGISEYKLHIEVLLVDQEESDERSWELDSEEHLVDGHIEVARQQAAQEHDSWVSAANAGGRGVCGVDRAGSGHGGVIGLAVHRYCQRKTFSSNQDAAFSLGVSNLFEPERYFTDAESHEGQPVGYTCLKLHIF